MKSAHHSNEIIDEMIATRRESNPEEVWTRDVPAIHQNRILGNNVTVAAESDAGRGAPVLDLYGLVPICGGAITDEVLISVKSTEGADRITGRTCVFTTGTERHIRAILAQLMNPDVSIPVLFVHRNTTNGQWVQTSFDACKVVRALYNLQGEGDYCEDSPAKWSTGKRGVPMVVRVREQIYKDTVYYYHQIRFNMAPLIAMGLVPEWRKVNSPTLELDDDTDTIASM